MPPRPRKKPRYPPTEGAYTLHDLYGEIGWSDLKKLVTGLKGKPTKDALVDELVRATPLDQLGMNQLQHICQAFDIDAGRKKEDCLAKLKMLLKQDDQNGALAVRAAVAAEVPASEDEDDEKGLEHLQNQGSCASSTSRDKRAATSSGDKEASGSGVRQGKAGQKRKQNGNADKVYQDMKIAQGKEEARARANAHGDDFSIKRCMSVLNTMEGLSTAEKAESFDLFKDAQNREIFICAEPGARLLWLRRQTATQTASDSDEADDADDGVL